MSTTAPSASTMVPSTEEIEEMIKHTADIALNLNAYWDQAMDVRYFKYKGLSDKQRQWQLCKELSEAEGVDWSEEMYGPYPPSDGSSGIPIHLFQKLVAREGDRIGGDHSHRFQPLVASSQVELSRQNGEDCRQSTGEKPGSMSILNQKLDSRTEPALPLYRNASSSSKQKPTTSHGKQQADVAKQQAKPAQLPSTAKTGTDGAGSKEQKPIPAQSPITGTEQNKKAVSASRAKPVHTPSSYAKQIAPETLAASGLGKIQIDPKWIEKDFTLSTQERDFWLGKGRAAYSCKDAVIEVYGVQCQELSSTSIAGETKYLYQFKGAKDKVDRAMEVYLQNFRAESAIITKAWARGESYPDPEELKSVKFRKVHPRLVQQLYSKMKTKDKQHEIAPSNETKQLEALKTSPSRSSTTKGSH